MFEKMLYTFNKVFTLRHEQNLRRDKNVVAKLLANPDTFVADIN